jgi:hypothetical protein
VQSISAAEVAEPERPPLPVQALEPVAPAQPVLVPVQVLRQRAPVLEQ